MIKIGLPTAGESMSYNLYQLVLLSFVNSMGNEAVNARVYCQALISFANVFSSSVAMSTQIITGHLVGAKNEDGAYRRVFASLKISLPVTVALAGVNCILSPFTLRIFTGNEQIIRIAFQVMLVDIVLAGLGVAGVFMGTAADECIRGLIVMLRWKSGKWRGKAIVDRE